MVKAMRLWLFVVFLCFAFLASGCSKPIQGGESTSAASSSHLTAARHDLSIDEERGGHTLQRHIGRSDAELRERLERERHISAASTYSDRNTAEQAIAAALQQNQERIARWSASSGGHPNLVLDYRSPQSLGRSMRRGESVSQPCSQSVVVLRWTPNGYYVLTSYPECR